MAINVTVSYLICIFNLILAAFPLQIPGSQFFNLQLTFEQLNLEISLLVNKNLTILVGQYGMCKPTEDKEQFLSRKAGLPE